MFEIVEECYVIHLHYFNFAKKRRRKLQIMNEVGIFQIIWNQTLCANEEKNLGMVKTAENTEYWSNGVPNYDNSINRKKIEQVMWGHSTCHHCFILNENVWLFSKNKNKNERPSQILNIMTFHSITCHARNKALVTRSSYTIKMHREYVHISYVFVW